MSKGIGYLKKLPPLLITLTLQFLFGETLSTSRKGNIKNCSEEKTISYLKIDNILLDATKTRHKKVANTIPSNFSNTATLQTVIVIYLGT